MSRVWREVVGLKGIGVRGVCVVFKEFPGSRVVVVVGVIRVVRVLVGMVVRRGKKGIVEGLGVLETVLLIRVCITRVMPWVTGMVMLTDGWMRVRVQGGRHDGTLVDQ